MFNKNMFNKKFTTFSLLLLIASFGLSIFTGLNPTRVFAANGVATFTNNLPTNADQSSPVGGLFVCINGKMLKTNPLENQISADFSGASGTYNFTVLDGGITFSEKANQVGYNGSNWDVFCQDLSIYDTNQIVGTGSFVLKDNQQTAIALNPNDFDIKISPYLVNLTADLPTATPGTTQLTIPNFGAFSKLCINGVLTTINNATSGWPLQPGTYQVSYPSFNLNVDPNGIPFCGGTYDDNPAITVTIAADTTINLPIAQSRNPEYYYKLGIVVSNPPDQVSSSSVTSSSLSSTPQIKTTVRTGGSDKK